MHSLCMATTLESLKDGCKGGTKTKKSTQFSVKYMSSSNAYPSVSQAALSTSRASRTQLTVPPGESTCPENFYSLQLSFLPSLDNSLSMQLNPQQLQNSAYCTMGATPLLPPKSSIEPCLDSKVQHTYKHPDKKKTKSSSTLSKSTGTQAVERQCFDVILPSIATDTPLNPQPYRTSLTPTPSPLRPHCLARDRLSYWKLFCEDTRRTITSNDPRELSISDSQLDRVLEVMGSSWAASTKEMYGAEEMYGARLLVFHVYCDTQQIAESQRCPISRPLLLAFLSSCTGSYSSSPLANYTAGLKAWHILHGHPWLIPAGELKSILDGAAKFAPPASKCAKRSPFTPAIIIEICNHLNLEDPKDSAIFACITTSFYSVARLGEFTVSAMKDFNPRKHITQGDVSEGIDRNGLVVTKFHLPSTKSAPKEGVKVVLS